MSAENEEWGPWIEHDGAEPWFPDDGREFDLMISESSESGTMSVDFVDEPITQNWPGFYWRWERRGFLGRKKVRVCDDHSFKPIYRYRFKKPPAEKAAFEAIRRVALDVKAPIDAPEIQPKPIKKKERTPWGTYR